MFILRYLTYILFGFFIMTECFASPAIKDELFSVYNQLEVEDPIMFSKLMTASSDFERIYNEAIRKSYRKKVYQIPAHKPVYVAFLPFDLIIGSMSRSAVNSLSERIILVDYTQWLTMGDDNKLLLVLTEYSRFWGIIGEDKRYEIAAQLYIDFFNMNFKIEYDSRGSSLNSEMVPGTIGYSDIVDSKHEDLFFISTSWPEGTIINFSKPYFSFLQNVGGEAGRYSYSRTNLVEWHRNPTIDICHNLIRKSKGRGPFILEFSHKTSLLIGCSFW